jgi:hypothetical protein
MDEFINRFDEDVLEWHAEEFGNKKKQAIASKGRKEKL